MELRVPHVTSYARAPSSLLFLRSARYPKMPRFLQFLREFWPMPLPLIIHSALALFAQRTRIPTTARSIGFCVIWVCISSSSSSKSSSSSSSSTSPERPTGPKPTPPCSQRRRRRGRLRELYEPRTRLPVRPGGLYRRRLDDTLSVSY